MNASAGSASSDNAGQARERPKEKKQFPSVLRNGWGPYLKSSTHAVLFTSKMNILLLCIPFAFLSRYTHWGDAPTFVFALLALCPLAEVRVGRCLL